MNTAITVTALICVTVILITIIGKAGKNDK